MSAETCKAGALPAELHPHADLRFCVAPCLMDGSTALNSTITARGSGNRGSACLHPEPARRPGRWTPFTIRTRLWCPRSTSGDCSSSTASASGLLADQRSRRFEWSVTPAWRCLVTCWTPPTTWLLATSSLRSPGPERPWLPRMDGAERLGVLGLTLPSIDEALRVRCTWLATLVAELLMTKGQYTDSYFLTRRRQPMSLAAEMQWQLLPPLTLVTPRVVIAGLLEPAYEVAGDAFDYALNGDTTHLAVIDPVGHDLTASVLAAVTVGSYRHSRRAGLGLAA